MNDPKIKEKIQVLIKIHFIDNETNCSESPIIDKMPKEIKENKNKNINPKLQILNINSNLCSIKSKNTKFYMMQENNKNETEINEIKKYENVFRDVKELFDCIMKDDNLIEEFINEIQEIIDVMHTIIYTPPYLILFGRISFEKPKIKDDKYKFMKDINQSFYDGFGF